MGLTQFSSPCLDPARLTGINYTTHCRLSKTQQLALLAKPGLVHSNASFSSLNQEPLPRLFELVIAVQLMAKDFPFHILSYILNKLNLYIKIIKQGIDKIKFLW